MSDELAIQQQKQGSATPYALGGAVVGGLAGAFSPVGVTKPKYSSYEDILKESDKIILNSIQSDYEIYLNKLNLDKSRLIVIPCRTEELEKCQSELKKLPEGSYYFLSIIAGVEEMTNIEGFETSRINLNFNPKWNKTLYFEKRY